MTYDKFFRYFLYCFCIFGILCNIQNSRRDTTTKERNRIEKIDTIYKTDTVIVEKPKLVYKYISKIDTVELKVANDTVYKQVEIPIETKEYKDSTYYCRISGFQPILEHLEVYPVQTTIEKKITQYREKKWDLSIQSGFGYGVFNKKPDLYIGVGISYNIK